MKVIERYYGETFKLILRAIDPFKRKIIKTECKVHIFNNNHSLCLLKKFGYIDEYKFFKKYLKYLNMGVVWADQGFKSINHFYNPNKNRGLLGHSNCLHVTEDYYKKSVKFWNTYDDLSMFYLGACVHIIQDLTIPQHVNIRLLDQHRQYENFVKYTYDLINEYIANDEPIILSTPKEYVNYNAKHAIKIGEDFKYIGDRKLKFYRQTLLSLPLSQRTTAGCFLMFYRDVISQKDLP